MAALKGSKTEDNLKARLRRRVPGEPPLSLFRPEGGRRRLQRRRRGVPLHRRRRDRSRARPSGIPRSGRRSGHRPADRQDRQQPGRRGRRRDARIHRHVPGHGAHRPRGRLRGDRRLVRDPGQGRALACRPLPARARRARSRRRRTGFAGSPPRAERPLRPMSHPADPAPCPTGESACAKAASRRPRATRSPGRIRNSTIRRRSTPSCGGCSISATPAGAASISAIRSRGCST